MAALWLRLIPKSIVRVHDLDRDFLEGGDLHLLPDRDLGGDDGFPDQFGQFRLEIQRHLPHLGCRHAADIDGLRFQ